MTKAAIVRNVLWNGAGLAIPLIAGFLLAPYLIHQLGQTRNGLWVLVLSWVDYFNLCDLGVGGAIGRTLAYHRARGERHLVNSALSTALAFLCGVAVLVFVASALLPTLFFDCYQVPSEDVAAATWAIWLVGFSVAVNFPLSAFDSTLWSLQRFDITNAVDIPTSLLRAAAIFALLWNGYGLVTLALVMLLVRLGNGLAKGWCCLRLEPGLRIGADLVTRAAARSMFGYSVWAFVLTVTRVLSERIAPQVIGARLALGAVTLQSVGAKLVGYSNGFIIAGTEVLKPVAIELHATDAHERQRELFLQGNKICTALSGFFAIAFFCLGQPFLMLWVGADLGRLAYPLLIVLVLGEAVPMAQWISYYMVMAMNRHRALAILCTIEVAVAIAASLWLVEPWGALGACIGVAVPAVIFRGFGQMVYALRVLEVSPRTYLQCTLLPAFAAVGLPALALALLCWWHMPGSWLELLAYGAIYALAFALTACLVLLGRGETWRVLAALWRNCFPLNAPDPSRPMLGLQIIRPLPSCLWHPDRLRNAKP